MRTGFGVPSGRRWFLAAGGAGVVALAGSGAALLTFSSAPATRPLADGCGLVACGASLPPSVTGLATRGAPAAARRHHPADPSAPAKPTPSPVPRATQPEPAPQPPRHHRPSPAPTPPPGRHSRGPRVTVTYTLDGGDGQGNHGFRAHLTIVSTGHQATPGWTIELSLPGDEVSWVGYPDAPLPFARWQFSGHLLVLHAASGGETLPPGGTEVVPISAAGPHKAPRGCTFNGAPCRP
jgi:hypothetical protein